MKKVVLLVFIIILFVSCSQKKDADQFLSNEYSVHVLPQIQNLNIDIREKDYQSILVLLHEKFKINEIKEKLKIKDDRMDLLINDLYSNGLIKLNENKEYIPTCFVITESDITHLQSFVQKTGEEMSGIAIDRLEIIKKEYTNTDLARNHSFENASLFVLGNVVHGNFQLKNVEEQFLKAEAPKRGSEKSYVSIIQKNNLDENFLFNLYTQKENFIDLKVVYTFGNDPWKKKVNDSNLKIEPLLISKKDQEIFNSLADLIFEDISNYLERIKPLMVKLYLNSNYKEETSFREFSMWIYQLLATSSINSLFQKKYITGTESISFHYQN
ncbi:MAG: hypothetical protein KF816_00695 [Melioribacteraceae bacterium]|nr:hypothetical protein [Melioribacteraceae bacterium]